MSLLISCAPTTKTEGTLDSLEDKEIHFIEVNPKTRKLSRDKVMDTYEYVLSKNAKSNDTLYQGAMRRLADLKLESGEEKNISRSKKLQAQSKVDLVSASRQYTKYLLRYPNKEGNDEVLYQLSKAYELLGEFENALKSLQQLISDYPDTKRWDEVQFRRGELLFLLQKYPQAAEIYTKLINADQKSLYYQNALYKYGWSLFKQNKHQQSLTAFFKLLDNKLVLTKASTEKASLLDNKLSSNQQAINQAIQKLGEIPKQANNVGSLTKSDQELINDAARAISLVFTYLKGSESVNEHFAENGGRDYEPLIYNRLAKLFLEKERILDAANTYLSFVKRHPQHDMAPIFHNDAIQAYKKGGFASLILPTKETFIENYGVATPYWQSHSLEVRNKLKPQIIKHITDLATHYHSIARKKGNKNSSKDYKKAAIWYEEFIISFPADKRTANMNFLLAESLFDNKQYSKAIVQYEKTAYDYPQHKKSSIAGYAAIEAYQKLAKQQLPTAEKILLSKKIIESALRFTTHFPKNKNVPAVLSQTAEQLFAAKDYLRATSVAQRLLKIPGKQSTTNKRTAWTIIGHAQFELANYEQAEKAYRKSLRYYGKKNKLRPAIITKLAATMYKQAEQLREQGKHQLAANKFLKITKIVPGTKIATTAEYDAAAEYISLSLWKKAGRLLEHFRRTQAKNHPLQAGTTEKLAVVYMQTGQHVKAAGELETLAAKSNNKAESQRLLWNAANIYSTARLNGRAKIAYKSYIKRFPSKQPEAMEARMQLVTIYKKEKDRKSQWYWLKDIIRTDKKYPNLRTDQTRNIVAQAMLSMAEPKHHAYNQVKLTFPLKKSLKKKNKLMQQAIDAYTVAINYEVAEVTTSATYRVAQIYQDFAKAIMKSERPKKLSAEALEEYEILLEEKSFPFEEKAIEIHVTNLSRINDGIYDKWVKSSLNSLSKLQPARYLKREKMDHYINAIH